MADYSRFLFNPAQPAGAPMINGNKVQGPGLGYYGPTDVYKPKTVTPSGGGGGSVLGASTSSDLGSLAPTAPTGPSEQEILQQELDSIFNPVFASLQGQEDVLRQNYAPVEGLIQEQGNLATKDLTNQYNTSNQSLTSEEGKLGTRKEDAFTSAARLYDEIQRGGRQRFGGASSAGEAYQTLTAVEQQRRQGNIQNLFEEGMQKVAVLKSNLKEKFDTAVQEVVLQTRQFIADAQTQFRDALQAIATAKNQAQTDKATASMNLLQDLRNKIYTINQQQLQFVQQLALNHEATQKQVDDMAAKAAQFVSGGQLASSNFNPQLSTQYGIVPGGNTASAPTVGTTGKTWKQDENGNWVYA